MFLGFVVALEVSFFLIWISNQLIAGSAWFEANLLEVFVGDYGADPKGQGVRDEFYTTFEVIALEMAVLLDVYGFVENICDNLAILVLNEDVYKW